MFEIVLRYGPKLNETDIIDTSERLFGRIVEALSYLANVALSAEWGVFQFNYVEDV